MGPTSPLTALAPEIQFDRGASSSLLLCPRGSTAVEPTGFLLRSDPVGAFGIGSSSSSLLLS
jgi:hypothetical protein